MAALAQSGEQVVELACGDLAVVRGARAVDDAPHLVERAAREGARAQDRRPRGEGEAARHGLHDVLARLVSGDEIPLVEQHHEAAASLDGEAGHLLVLLGHALGGVHHEHADVGLVDGAKAAHHTVVLDVLVHEVALAHAGSVDKTVATPVVLDHNVEGVARGAGHVGDDGAVTTGEAVGDGALAHVGPADDGDAQGVCRVGALGCLLGKGRDDLVEEVARAVAVRGRDGAWLTEAEGVELPDGLLVVGVVELVGHEEDRLLGAAQDARDRLVLLGDAGARVHNEDDGVGLSAGGLGLLADAAGEGVVGLAGLDAAGVDQREVAAVPVGVVVAAVARDAAALVDDGLPGLGYAVHQRGLAHVGATDDGDDGLGHAYSLLACSKPNSLPCIPTASPTTTEATDARGGLGTYRGGVTSGHGTQAQKAGPRT